MNYWYNFISFTVDVRVFSFSIIVSLDYLMKIKDFFEVPQSSQAGPSYATQQKSVSDQAVKKRSAPQTPVSEPVMFTINLHVEKPDIILLEDMDNINSNCIVLNVSVLKIHSSTL